MPAYQQSAAAVVAQLRSDAGRGLSQAEATRRCQIHGPNALEKRGRSPLYELLRHQFQDLLIGLLAIAAVLSYYLDDRRGAAILLAIVLINALIGFYQEYKAERLLERLTTLIRARATAVRDGVHVEISERDLVPGDVVALQAGDAVPADIRLIETHGFATNDFTLTGESIPQEKDADLIIDHDVQVTDRNNLAFLGTTVARGTATGVVIATGMATALGDIASAGQTIQRDLSPLQQEINTLARMLTKLAGLVVIVLFATNILLRADSFPDVGSLFNSSLLFAIGVTAACVPQGLPAQITVALSLGVGRLARAGAVVKRLSAVETLGCTTVVCSDKTGTITANEMTILCGWADGHTFEVTGHGYDPRGEILEGGRPVSVERLEEVKQFFQHGLLASNGRTHPPDEEHPSWYAVGDPTEAAFMPFAVKAGLDPDERGAAFPLQHELPFDSRRKRMTMVRKHKGRTIGYMKGATESVLAACSGIHRGGRAELLDDKAREAIAAKVEEFSSAALRVIALAYRDFPEGGEALPIAEAERDFVFAGLVGMIDPPRPGVPEAIVGVTAAQVRVFMLTGDDPRTAEAIAGRIGMQKGRVLTGDDLRRLSGIELRALLRDSSLIFSRVSPGDKFQIVALLKKMGNVVAVTGDGVNDTLSLKQANIGVAMGKLGSDVAKEAAEIVLTDDNFTTLVKAIREGRTIFQNLQSVILSSLTSNIGELSCVCLGFAGTAFGLPLPISTVQILSIDLIGEMLPLMALTFDPAEATLMRRPPRKLGAHIVVSRRLVELAFFGALMGTSGYVSFYMVLETDGTPGMAQAAAFVGIMLAQYVNILSRRTAVSVFGHHVFANWRLWAALAASFFIVAAMVSLPAIGVWFGFEPLRLQDWLWPAAGALVFMLCFEGRKRISAATSGGEAMATSKTGSPSNKGLHGRQ